MKMKRMSIVGASVLLGAAILPQFLFRFISLKTKVSRCLWTERMPESVGH